MSTQEIIAAIRRLPVEEQKQILEALRKNLERSEITEEPFDQTAAESKRQQRMEWLEAHRTEYAGQYVALDGNRLLGTGKTYPEAADAARRAGVQNAYVDYVHPPDAEGYMGGW